MRWRHCGDARPDCQTPSRFVVAHCQQQADGATETGELMPGYVIVWSEDAKAEIETLPAFRWPPIEKRSPISRIRPRSRQGIGSVSDEKRCPRSIPIRLGNNGSARTGSFTPWKVGPSQFFGLF